MQIRLSTRRALCNESQKWAGQNHVPARLLAVRAAQEAVGRRYNLREEAQRRGKPVSQKRLRVGQPV
jgi:hypothetical protein